MRDPSDDLYVQFTYILLSDSEKKENSLCKVNLIFYKDGDKETSLNRSCTTPATNNQMHSAINVCLNKLLDTEN